VGSPQSLLDYRGAHTVFDVQGSGAVEMEHNQARSCSSAVMHESS
jgi:hypothetical protein